jgi:DNA-binding IclR family transcriptional regulator
VAQKDQFFSLQETWLRKLACPTNAAPNAQQLESAGILQRDGDGRHYSTGLRLRRLAETLLLNNTVHGARHMVLRRLVDEVGESCNITALSGSEVLYLDRVETPAPLRFYCNQARGFRSLFGKWQTISGPNESQSASSPA